MKHSIIRMLGLVSLFVALVSFAPPIAVHAAGTCLSGNATVFTTTGQVAVRAGDVVTASVRTNDSSDLIIVQIFSAPGGALLASGAGIGSASASATIASPGLVFAFYNDFAGSFSSMETFSWSLAVNGGCPGSAGAGGPLFSDSRLNNHDGAESAAIYCDKGSVVVFSVGNPWQITLRVTTAEIDRVPSLPATNTLIKQNAKAGVALYRLTSGELQINAPGDAKGPYSFTFTDCPRDH